MSSAGPVAPPGYGSSIERIVESVKPGLTEFSPRQPPFPARER